MKRVTIFVEPLEVLQFRDHRPFDAGEHSWAHGVFPAPSVLFGFLRTILFEAAGADFYAGDDFGVPDWARAWLGGARSRGSLSLRGPLLAQREGTVIKPAFPWPRDLVAVEKQYEVLTPWAPAQSRRVHWSGGKADVATTDIPWTPHRLSKSKRGPQLLTPSGAAKYLNCIGGALYLEDQDLLAQHRAMQPERRVGITRNADSLTAADHMFYVTDTLRFAPDWGLALDVADPEGEAGALLRTLDGSIQRLGGSGRCVRLHLAESPLWSDELRGPTGAGTGGSKLWLCTPLIPRTANFPHADVRCCITERGQRAGGYDMAARAPKPLRLTLPAGTVMHLKVKVDRRSGSDLLQDGEDTRAGYGAALSAVEA